MTKHIHIHIHRARTADAGFEESKHKRAENGQFGSGGGSAAPAKKSATPAVAVKHANRGAGALAQLQAKSNAHLKATGHGHLVDKPKNSPGTGGASSGSAKKAAGGYTPEKLRSLSQLDKLERSIGMMQARRVAPVHQPAHERDLKEFKEQYARKRAAHEATHGAISPSDWSHLKESSSRTNETKLENENVAKYGKVK